jgi:hypothetical protein
MGALGFEDLLTQLAGSLRTVPGGAPEADLQLLAGLLAETSAPTPGPIPIDLAWLFALSTVVGAPSEAKEQAVASVAEPAPEGSKPQRAVLHRITPFRTSTLTGSVPAGFAFPSEETALASMANGGCGCRSMDALWRPPCGGWVSFCPTRPLFV